MKIIDELNMFHLIMTSLLNALREFWYFPLGLFIIAIIKVVLSSSKVKGTIGESQVNDFLKKLPREDYTVLNDIMIITQSGSSQIDHIVLSKYGFFIIESKNYKGFIYGNEYNSTWTQNIYGNKYSFQNPIHQNFGHIKRLEELDELFTELNLIPIVTFCDQAQFKFKIDNVVHFSELKPLILSYNQYSISNHNLNLIESIINISNITDRKYRKKHIKDIRENNK